MNTVTDLAARAVSFITLIQDTFLKGQAPSTQSTKMVLNGMFCTDFRERLEDYIKKEEKKSDQRDKDGLTYFEKRAIELVWISAGDPRQAYKDPAQQIETGVDAAVAYTVELSTRLAGWICGHREAIFDKLKAYGSLPTPFSWREAISQVLYPSASERVALAEALQYLPVQVVLVLGCQSYSAQEQRMAQLWQIDKKYEALLLAPMERKKRHELSKEEVTPILEDDKSLLERLRKDSPLPFELVFSEELEEIKKSRRQRNQEYCQESARRRRQEKASEEDRLKLKSADPFIRAEAMELYALAFSGGGIRSATFNLGILQGLARRGLIGQFDYLSTVSGGGYIGSWLAAWIKRDGSVTKVTDRLNPDKSPDPFGEEVAPIRWLRMFSNYFAPNASIMSVDAWTVGITWLRNTLLNQLILLMLFLSALLLENGLYNIWLDYIRWDKTSSAQVYLCSILLLLPVTVLMGWGMRSYYKEAFPSIPDRSKRANKISGWLISIGLLGAYLVSAWLFSRSHVADYSLSDFADKLRLLRPAAVVCWVTLFIVAIFGRYDRCIKSPAVNPIPGWTSVIWPTMVWTVILITAAAATFIGELFLALGWELMQKIDRSYYYLDREFARGLAFTVGPPIMLEAFSITVVARMAFLGKYFPDERREWWGRIGGIIHRLSFIWLLLAGSSLLGLNFLSHILDSWKGKVAVGGWVALVGSTVKAAFSSKTSGKGEKGPLSVALDILAKAGPYLFVLGILVFSPALLNQLLKLKDKIPFFSNPETATWLVPLILFIILFALAIALAWRVGVNEFSMHHFYRNRLVRAYLGATRRRTERARTANPYTNFDMRDDVKLSELKNEHGYYGPYPILNTALNASEASSLDRQDRKAESFIFSPLYCGFDFSMTRASADAASKTYDYGYRPTELFAYPNDQGPGIGTAMAISGAAVNPNQGYHSSAATAFLLTVFNVQMGWWIGNPRKNKWKLADPRLGLGYIIYNLIGKTSTRENFVCLSDGGHFDNMGLYELVRRRCAFIVLGDSEQDNEFTCEGLANAIRRCRIDFGAEIDIDVEEITDRDEHHFSKKNYALGSIRFAGDGKPTGVLLYIKSSVMGNEPVDVQEYKRKHDTFPHQTTGDQFFDEAQFESYRQLGLHIADAAMSDPKVMEALRLTLPLRRNGVQRFLKAAQRLFK